MLFFLLYINVCLSLKPQADPGKILLKECYAKIDKVNTFKARAVVDFNLPNMEMNSVKGDVYFKKPKKFKIKSQGIVFLPKNNPFDLFQFIKEIDSYQAISSGEEMVSQKFCKIIHLIPNQADDIILAKCWIDPESKNLMKSQLTTKSNGTIGTEFNYSLNGKYGLPDNMLFTIEMTKFKMPKLLTGELNSKRKAAKNGEDKKEQGTIKINFSNYQVNAQFDEAVFQK